MKRTATILVCLLPSVWAIFTFFHSSGDVSAPQSVMQTDIKDSVPAIPAQPAFAKAGPVFVQTGRPGKAVRLELPAEKGLREKRLESAGEYTNTALKKSSRAIRVVPRQPKTAEEVGPIPEPAMTVSAEFVVQEGHAGDIEGLAFGPNGKYLATAEYNKRVKLWDLRTGQLIRTFHHNFIYEHGPIVEFGADGQWLYTGGGMPFKIKAWDLPSNKLVREATLNSVASFQKGPEGSILAGYGWDQLTIMDGRQLGILRVMKSKHQWGSFESIVMDCDSRRCFSGHSNGTIAHWDIESGVQVHEFTGHQGQVGKLFVTKDGKTLISVGWEDGQVKIWDRPTFKLIRTIQAHAPDHSLKRSHLHGAALDPSQRYLLTGGSDGYVKLWSLEEGRLLRTFQKAGLSRYEEIRVLGIDPLGKYVAAGGREGQVWVWDFDSGQIIRKISGRLPQETQRDRVAFQSETNRALNDADLADVPLIVDVNPGLDHVAIRNDRDEYAIWDLQGVCLRKHFPAWENVTFCKLGPFGKRAYTGHRDGRLIVWDLAAGVLLKELNPTDPKMQVSRIDISPDAQTLVSLHQLCQQFKYEKDNVLHIWDLSTGRQINALQGWHHVRIDPQWRFIVALQGEKEKKILRYEFASRKITTLAEFNGYYQSFDLIRDGSIAVICDTQNRLFFWLTNTGKPLPGPEVGDESKKRVLIDHSGRYVLYAPCIEASVNSSYEAVSATEVGGRDISPWKPETGTPKDLLISSTMRSVRRTPAFKSEATIWDIDKGKICCRITVERELVAVKLIPALAMAVSAHSGTLTVWSLKSGERIREIKLSRNFCINRLSVDPQGKRFVVSTCQGLYVGDLQTGNILASYDDLRNLDLLLVINDTPLSDGPVVLCVDKLDVGTFIDLQTGAKLNLGKFGPANRLRPEFLANGRVLAYSRHNSNVIEVWNLVNPERLSLVSGGREWLAYTSKGYFDSSRHGGKLIAMVDGLHVFGVDQFAIRNNRPDLIMQAMDMGSDTQKQHYYHRFLKRLRKSGFLPEQLSSDLHVPEVTIKDIRQKDKFLEVTFQLKDDRYPLKRYGIYVNDVSVFGSQGQPVEGRKAEFTETVELTSGKNKIEITCLNEKGAESYRALTFADYNQPVKGDLYFIGFGVSTYKDPKLNLKYAHKDALDLEAIFKKMTDSYDTVYHRAFVNEEVTVETIQQIRHLLANAKVDDTLVLFMAGHGVHDLDKEATYYYLTHDTSPENLSGTGASFESIEDLLTEAKPRKKLFLMDTCESGELDESALDTYFAMAGARGFRARTTRAIRVFGRIAQKNANRQFLYNQDRYIYNELDRRSGAIVFSSSRGGEFSYESDRVENGFFTEAVVQALTVAISDPTKSRTISTDQLRAYVSRAVSDMSAGMQHPTVDRDNIYQSLLFQVVNGASEHP